MPIDQDTPVGPNDRSELTQDEVERLTSSGVTDLAAGFSAWQRKMVVDAAAPRARGQFMSSIRESTVGSAMGRKAMAAIRKRLIDMAKLYLNTADRRAPLAAPIYADLKGLAPLLIQVGACETLLDDGLRLAKVAGAADVRADLQIWPEMVHVWHLFHPEPKAGLRAIEAGGAFVRPMLSSQYRRLFAPHHRAHRHEATIRRSLSLGRCCSAE